MAYLDRMLAQDEHVRHRAHRHVLFLLTRTALYILGTIALWTLAIIVLRLENAVSAIVAVILLVLSVVPLAIAVYRLLAWRMEEYVVTNYRVIQVEGIANKRTFDTSLEKVNDVLMTQSVLGRAFGYGNIDIITGSEIGVNQLTAISDPFSFKRSLLEAKMELDGFGGSRLASDGRRDQSRLLSALGELRDAGVISEDEYEERKRQMARGV